MIRNKYDIVKKKQLKKKTKQNRECMKKKKA